MVEVVIAISVFAVIASFTSHLMAGGLKGVLLGKRREVATQEANRVLEVARSLAYDQIGLVESDPTIATDMVPSGAIREEPDDSLSYDSGEGWEPLIWANNSLDHPFNPHVDHLTRGSTNLARYVYVTGVDSDGDDVSDLKRISVRVTWDDTGTAKNEVRAQTLVNESSLPPAPPPSGCPAPCATSTPLTADTRTAGASMTVKTARGTIEGLVDAVLPEDPATFTLPTTTGEVKYRTISDVNCSAKSAELVGADNKYGGHPVSASADDDAQSETGAQPLVDSWSGSPPDQINLGDDIDDILLETTLASPVSCQATAVDTDGQSPIDDRLPYEKGTASSSGALNLIEDLSGLGLPSDQLTAVNITTAPISQEIDHQTVAAQREVYANSAASVGTVAVGKIPGVFPEGLVKVDAFDYSASVRGSADAPSAAPSVTPPSTITLRVYDVANEVTECSSRSGDYCIITVNPGVSGFAGLSINYEHNVFQSIGTELLYEVHVDFLPPAKSPADGVIGPNGERRWSADYTPIAISTRLKSNLSVPLLGEVLLTDTKVDLNLGSVHAQACAGGTCL